MASARLESLHAQLGTLLENAQSLLADSAPSSASGHAYYGGAGQFGGSQRSGTPATATAQPPAVYSFINMQVISDGCLCSPSYSKCKPSGFFSVLFYVTKHMYIILVKYVPSALERVM